MVWVAHYFSDLESDFSAIHRVDDINTMDGPDFFRKAWRISAYQGVMKMRVLNQLNEDQNSTSTVAGTPQPARGADDVRELTPAQMAVVHPGLFEMGLG